MNKYPKAVVLLILAVGFTHFLPAAGSAGGSFGEKETQGMGTFVHTVLFWFNETADEDAKRRLVNDCKTLLGSISTVKFLAVGPPAGTPRGVVDNCYDVGLVVHFEDQAGHDHYQTDQKHFDFIERNQKTWRRVQVYDIQAE